MLARKRLSVMLLIDILVINAALLIALLLRFDGDVPPEFIVSYKNLTAYFTVTLIACFFFFGLYNRIWKYASTNEMLSILYAVTTGTVFNIAITYFLQETHPRSIFIISWILNIFLVGGSRLAWRLFREHKITFHKVLGGKPALIVGAGDAGAMVVRELRRHEGVNLNPVGFVDDAGSKQKQHLMGLPVLGRREDIPRLVEQYGIQEIIIAMPSVPGNVIRDLMGICQGTRAGLKILPSMYDLIDGKVTVNQIREVQVEDLLRREPVSVDLEEIASYVKGNTVVVTGAGGSIGSELCRQIAHYAPKQLLLLGHGENSIFKIEQELKYNYPLLNLIPLIVDVRDREKTNYVFKKYKPQVVFHAAAHKHVPLMELNPDEAVKNNILGTKNVADAADMIQSKVFVLISTDKAVNPTSIMGTTKRVAEMIVQTLANRSKTRFVAVRFGNVLGSRGSVLPTFKGQIARGGPLTVTHPEMTRYFMTIPEAVQLVIQAGAMAEGGEVFVLDMGEPVKILDLAEDLIRLSGLEPGVDIEIQITGIRPGEKLYEELLTSEEGTTATRHKRIFVAKSNHINIALLEDSLQCLASGISHDNEKIVGMLQELVPTYRHKNCDVQAS